jgi:hypothetical protein
MSHEAILNALSEDEYIVWCPSFDIIHAFHLYITVLVKDRFETMIL